MPNERQEDMNVQNEGEVVENENSQQEGEDQEKADLEAELEQVKAETEEAEAAASDAEGERDATGQVSESDEGAQHAQEEAEAAHARTQQVEDDYNQTPQFDSRNIVEEHGEWAVTHQGMAHLRYNIFISSDMLHVFSQEYVESRFPFTNAEEFGVALDAAKEYHSEDDEEDAE